MKKFKKIVVILLVAVILGGSYGWFFVYNKPHRDYEKAKADYELTASEFYQQYAKSGDEANTYTGKVLQVYGKPSVIEDSDTLVVLAFVFNEGMFGDEGVRCTMLEKYHDQTRALDLSAGVSIKGYCTGYNGTDVILEQCSIVNN